MTDEEIELSARRLQVEIYRKRHLLWPDGHPPIVRMFDVEVATKVLGLDLERCEYLYWPLKDGSKGEVAGMIDREEKRITLSIKFRPAVLRFTGAHELGHWELHTSEIMFRDAPIEGASTPNAPRLKVEREADHFAACYLMQRRLVHDVFVERFRQFTPFPFNYDTAMLLRPHDPVSLLRETDIYERAAVLASIKKFSNLRFYSLAEVFQVSVKSMAIRLVELELVKM